ncbi:MAG: peptide/nickel transport system substrate-binding protein [Acetobacteraceae bacterium]|nr:peptide/nickel transport system substrate-binding protein [Acetobacteraceae bacterium]
MAAGLVAGMSVPDARAGDRTIRASLNTELQSLDPVYASVNATRVFSYLVFDTLIAIDNEGKYHPQMLEGWEISPDRMSYRFRLRDGLTWSDGTPVTAEDCVASIQRWAKRESFGGQLVAATRDFVVVDANTFELHLNRPFAFVIETLGKPGIVVPIMMPARLAKLDATKPVPEVVGSGPFLFRRNEWRPGERAIFDRNPNYHPRSEQPDGLSGGKTVRVDRVDFVSMPDQATRVAALQTGELDLLEVVPFDFIDVLRKDPGVTVMLQQGIQQMMDVIGINHLQPPFNNVLMRRALQAAVGQADVMAAYGLPKSMYQTQCLSIYMCDAPGTTDAGTEVYKSAGIERAKALLKEASYNNEKVVFLHAATSALLDPVGLVVADQMRRAGFNVDFRTSDYATVAERRRSRAPVEGGGWSVAPIVWNGIDLVNPLSDPTVSNNCTDNYPGWYCDPKLTELLRQYSETEDPGQRTQLEAQIQAEFHSNVNLVLAGQFSAPMAYRSDLKGVVPFGFPVFWNMERK